MKYHGRNEEFRELINGLGFEGEWSEEGGKLCFRNSKRSVVNWFPSTGTVQVQGKDSGPISEAIDAALSGEEVPRTIAANEKKNAQIFIVHGHDRDARDQLELVLRRLKLDPFILQNEDGGGKTLIEALEQNIYDDAAFGIVLVTPDDYGYAKADGEEARAPRARQNVVLEMGMVMAALSRERMVVLKKGEVEMPSDTDGLIYLGFNDRVQDVVPGLVKRLKAAGIEIDDSLVADASA